MKTKLSNFVILALLCACATTVSGGGDVEQAIAAAKAAQEKADALQGGWTTTDELIKQAEQAAAKGDSNKALQLAEKAKHEAELALAQAEHERDHWSPPPYLMPQ